MPVGQYTKTKEQNQKIAERIKELWQNPEYRANMVKKHTGKKQSPETIEKRVSQFRGKLNYNWKGENICYQTVHKWINQVMGKPDTCGKCGKSGLKRNQIHWANKSGKYRRKVSDWLRLCMSCHMLYDFKKGMRLKK